MFELFCLQRLQPERGFCMPVAPIKEAFWTWFAYKKQFHHLAEFTDIQLHDCMRKKFYLGQEEELLLNFRLL